MTASGSRAPGLAGAGDMPVEEFRQRADEVVRWIASYLEGVERLPVMARVRPGEVREAVASTPPAVGEPMEDILRDFREVVLPGITHWNHPSFHAYFAVTGSGPGILGEMLSSALNVNGMVWRGSPSVTELEEAAADWVRQLLGLPEPYRGVIQDTASTSSMVALVSARHRAYPEAREQGLFGLPRGRVYASEEAHSSIEKAVLTLGLGKEGLRRIGTDDRFRMDPSDLRSAVAEDEAAGIRPIAVVGTAGTTSTTSVDPLPELADVAERSGAWLHVDAAYAGAAAALPELRGRFDGWERADSIVMNPHKWLFTPVDCSLLFMRDPESVRAAFSLVPEYLRTAEDGRATNLMDYGVALGRRFRALKLWFVLRYFGVEGIRDRIRQHVELARGLAEAVDAEEGWERVAPVPFSTVVFRHVPAGLPEPERDRWNLRLMDEVNESGAAFLSHTKLRGRTYLRVSIGNLRTRGEHVERLWDRLRETSRATRRPTGPPAG